MKNRIVAGALAVSALALMLAGCAADSPEVAAEKQATLNETACEWIAETAVTAQGHIDAVEREEFWALGAETRDYAPETGGGDVQAAFESMGTMFSEDSPSIKITRMEVETYNGHLSEIIAACGEVGEYHIAKIVFPSDPEVGTRLGQ